MDKPLLSVCLLTYNQAKYVRQAVDSILAQEVTVPWQLVIADDASTDGTKEILQDYKKKFPDRIHLILQKVNVGPEENWLTLMDYAKSKYVLYCEGDDYFTDTTKLQQQVDFLETHKDFSICFHPVQVVYEDGSRPNELFPTPKQRFEKDVLELKDLLANNFIQTNSAMYRWRFKSQSMKEGYPRGIAPGDWYLHVLHADKGKIGFINRPMSTYRKHAGGLWWDAHHNKDKFWGKYGLAWLGLYMQFLKMYGSVPAYRQIIEGSTINLLNELVDADKKHHHGLFNQAIAALPEAADIYINNLREQITALHSHANEQAKIIDHYVRLSQQLESDMQQVKGEHDKLAIRPLIRLENAVKRRLKRRNR